MTDKFTPDSTVIAAAENLCVAAIQAGAEPVFTGESAGLYATFRQRRLFESAMQERMTRGHPHLAAVHSLAAANVERFRFENYGQA